MEEYQLTITTSGRYAAAGTNATVYAKITGAEGIASKWKTLDYFFKNDFQKGSTETYKILNKEDRIGPPVLLHLKLGGLLSFDAWFCDEVHVLYEDTSYVFSTYEWIEEGEVVVYEGGACLPQKLSNPAVIMARKTEITEKKQKYQWNARPESEEDPAWGISRYLSKESLNGSSSLLRKSVGKLKQKGEWLVNTSINTTANLIEGLFTKLHVVDDYKKLYRSAGTEDPRFVNDWRKDDEFGRQILNGISPLAIEKCTDLPAYCKIISSDVQKSFPNDGIALESEMKAGKIYIVDCTVADSVKRNMNSSTEELYVHADCIGLFHVNSDGKFLPLAIQLTPDSRDHIFTPFDDDYDWLLAKMYFRSSMLMFQQWVYRYVWTHSTIETFAAALLRNLSKNHPVYKLLYPHLRNIADADKRMREQVLHTGSDVDEALSLNSLDMIRLGYKDFRLENLDLPKVLKRKGLDDPKLLPSFCFRDDGMMLWDAIEKYLGAVLDIFYTCDTDVKEDHELQSFMKDVCQEGFGWQDGNSRGMLEKIESKTELVNLCTVITFTSTVHHAAVNDGIMETCQFIPNAPCAMVLPVHKKGEATLERIMNSLPDVKTSIVMIAYVTAMSSQASDETHLGDVPERLFTEEAVAELQDAFKKALEEISEKINNRNKNLKYSYTCLLPESIPLSITD